MLSVVNQAKDDFLASMLEEIGDEYKDEDFKENYINLTEIGAQNFFCFFSEKKFNANFPLNENGEGVVQHLDKQLKNSVDFLKENRIRR